MHCTKLFVWVLLLMIIDYKCYMTQIYSASPALLLPPITHRLAHLGGRGGNGADSTIEQQRGVRGGQCRLHPGDLDLVSSMFPVSILGYIINL